MRNLPDDHVQELLNELQDSGEQHARARARMRELEEKRRVLKAQLMKLAEMLQGLKSVGRQEAYALIHPSYGGLVDELVQAVLNEGLSDYRRRDAEIQYEIWRSLHATARADRSKL